jgi:hypothetical protein
MHMPPLTHILVDGQERRVFEPEDYDVDNTMHSYIEMKERVQERLKEAKGLLSGAHQLRLLLYIEARAMREYGWVI